MRASAQSLSSSSSGDHPRSGDKGGRCPDGTITVARSADKLAVGWFGSIKENTIVAFGTLGKK